MLTPRPNRGGERGQVLALALAFILFFGALTVAVLEYASVAALQHGRTESTALSDASAQGGAVFAASDSSRGDSACTPGASRELHMQTGDQVGYVIQQCNPAGSVPAVGAACMLCVLNVGRAGSPLTIGRDLAVPGEVDVNGNVTVGPGAVLSAGPSTTVGLYNGAPTGTVTPGWTAIATQITDPLSHALPTPPPSRRGSCAADGQRALAPGVYGTVDIDEDTVLCTGVFVITGALTASGNARVTSNGPVLIYLKATGSLRFSGSVNVDLAPYQASSGSPYTGIVLFVDPSNSGDISVGGEATVALHGTADAAPAGISIGADATLSIAGRLIADSVAVAGGQSQQGQSGPGLLMSGAVTSGISHCTVYNASVSGQSTIGSNVSARAAGTAVINAGCNRGTGITSFNYGG